MSSKQPAKPRPPSQDRQAKAKSPPSQPLSQIAAKAKTANPSQAASQSQAKTSAVLLLLYLHIDAFKDDCRTKETVS